MADNQITLLQIINKHIENYFHNQQYQSIKALTSTLFHSNHNILVNDKQIKKIKSYSYNEIQDLLSNIVIGETIKNGKQKQNGVFYTPQDVVHFILQSAVSVNYEYVNDCLVVDDNQLSENQILELCFEKSFFEPTCGSGEFLLSILNMKIKLLKSIGYDIQYSDLLKIVATLNGNDIDDKAIFIVKLRMVLLLLNAFACTETIDLLKHDLLLVLDNCFMCHNFIQLNCHLFNKKYDFIIGNPPYVEDKKYDFIIGSEGAAPPYVEDKKYDFIVGSDGVGEAPPYVEYNKIKTNLILVDKQNKYGNIYANVLSNSLKLLKPNGLMAFVIPISFIATPRMAKIRNELISQLQKLFILSYSDRPDCLFTGVHQKINIIVGQNNNDNDNDSGNANSDTANDKNISIQNCDIYTGNCRYWYKNERRELFKNVEIIKNNDFVSDKFIPKLGNQFDIDIYNKINKINLSLLDFIKLNEPNKELLTVYLNMRCGYWVKAFLNKNSSMSSEYKQYQFNDLAKASFFMCLMNSNLFWWYWNAVSDCWHITQKEFEFLKIPNNIDYQPFIQLAKDLENQLETTKEYVGTKQVGYEYKHKLCMQQINNINDIINHLYGLTKDEQHYINHFNLNYRLNNHAIIDNK